VSDGVDTQRWMGVAHAVAKGAGGCGCANGSRRAEADQILFCSVLQRCGRTIT
jgi:hypothetical protein